MDVSTATVDPWPTHRRRGHRWVRWALLALVALLLLCWSMPLWMPTGWLCRRVESDLAGQLGVPVEIESMSLSWRRGITITGLTIANPEGFGNASLLTADQLRLPLAPIDLLIRDRIDWLEVHRPSVNIVVTDDGEFNLDILRNLEDDHDLGRLVVEDATACIDIASLDNELLINLDRLEFRAGRLEKIGTVTMAARLHQDQRSSAPITLTVESALDRNTATRASFTFEDIALSDWGLPALLGLPLDGLSGTVTGSLILTVTQAGAIERSVLDLTGSEIVITPIDQPALAPLDRVHISVTGAYDPMDAGDIIQIQSLEISADDVLLLTGEATISAGVFTGDWRAADHLALAGYIDPAGLERSLLPRTDRRNNLPTINGPVAFDLMLVQDDNTIGGDLELSAVDAEICRGQDIVKPAGRPCRLEFVGEYRHNTSRLSIPEFAAALGDNEITGSLMMNRFADWVEAEPRSAVEWLSLLEQTESEGRVTISDIPSLQQATPDLTALWDQLTVEGLRSGSRREGQIRLDWSLFSQQSRRFVVTASVPSVATVMLGRSFVKPPHEPITLTASGTLSSEGDQLEHLDIDLSIGQGQLLFSDGQLGWDSSPESSMQLSGEFSANGIDGLLSCYRDVTGFSYGPTGNVQGGIQFEVADDETLVTIDCDEVDLVAELADGGEGIIHGSVGLACRRAGHGLDLMLDATSLDMLWEQDGTYQKQAGETLVVNSHITMDPSGASPPVVGIDIALGGSRLTMERGADRATQYAGLIVVDDALCALWPDLARLAEQTGLAGRAGIQGQMIPRTEGADLILELDGRELAWNYADQFAKPEGMAMNAIMTVTFSTDPSLVAGSVLTDPSQISLSIADATLGPINMNGSASYSLVTAEADHGLISQGRFDITISDAPALATIFPRSPLSAGQVRTQVGWLLGDERLYLGHQSELSDLRLIHRGREVMFSGPISSRVVVVPTDAPDTPVLLLAHQLNLPDRGPVEVILESLVTDGLEFDVAGAHGYVVADLAQSPDALTGQVYVLANTVDAADLTEWLAGSLPPRPEEFTLTEAEFDALTAQAESRVSLLKATLPRAQISLYADIDHFRTYDPMIQVFHELSNFALTVEIDNGAVAIEYAAGLSSGSLSRQYLTDLNAPEPELHFIGNLSDVVARPNIARQIEWTFPENRVTGLFNHHEDLSMSLTAALANAADWRYPTCSTGEARTIALRGTTCGQAAPDFITNIFPGLNTAEYEYDQMSALATYHSDGTVVNDVVFSGRSYDMYMEGTTDRDHMAEYEIGVILLSEPQTPEWNHLYRQGRIPVLNFEGRIEWGQFVDVNVTYPWPTETLYSVFLKNNYFYRLWVVDHQRDAVRRTETVLPPLESVLQEPESNASP